MPSAWPPTSSRSWRSGCRWWRTARRRWARVSPAVQSARSARWRSARSTRRRWSPPARASRWPAPRRAARPVLTEPGRRRGGRGGRGAARGAGVSVTARPDELGRPLGLGALVAGLARAVLVIVLLARDVRAAFTLARLEWAYLAALAFALSLFAVPIVRALALRVGALDAPAARKVHHVPTPLLGGAAVWSAVAVTVLFNFHFSRGLKGVAVGAAIVVLLGIVDDVVDLPATVKLGGQVAGVAVAMGYGVVLSVVPYWWPASFLLNVVLTLLWFLTVTNAVQFLDGMDGLATGLGIIAALFFAVTARQTNQPYLFFLAAPMVGACLGF